MPVGSSSNPAYEVHDFQADAIIELGLGPAVAGDDIAAQLHRYPIGLHSEEDDKAGKGKWNLGVERAFFAVDVKFHSPEAWGIAVTITRPGILQQRPC